MSKLKSGARRHKRPLTVRMLVAQLSWLEGRRLWQDGRVVWQHERGVLTPSIADLANAQRCLRKIEKYPQASQRVLGDSENWLERHYQRLEDAKKLQRLCAPDLELLGRDSRSRNPAAIARLVQLLAAETACGNELPFRPSEALSRNALAIAPLREFIDASEASLHVRVLAALVLGALSRRHDLDAREQGEETFHNEALHRAWKFGNENGLPIVPSLTAYLLMHEKGSSLARRFEYSIRQLPTEFCAVLREMMFVGVEAPRIVSFSESAAPFAAIADEINRFYRGWLDISEHGEGRKYERRVADWRRAWLQSRDDALAAFWRLVRDFLRVLKHPWQVRRFRTVLANQISLVTRFPYSQDHISRNPQTAEAWTQVFNHAYAWLRAALELPGDLVCAYLELLGECQGKRWKAHKDLAVLPHRTPGKLSEWLHEKWWRDVDELRQLLQKCGDGEVARDALRLNLHRYLSQRRWSDVEKYRCFLNWHEEFLSGLKYSTSWELGETLDSFRTAREARAEFRALLDALRAEPAEARGELFANALDIATDSRRERNAVLYRMCGYLPEISRYVQRCREFQEHCSGSHAMRGALEIDRAFHCKITRQDENEREETPDAQSPFDEYSQETPEVLCDAATGQAKQWVQWTLEHVLEFQMKTHQHWLDFLPDAVRFSLALCDSDFDSYQAIFRRALRHHFQDFDVVEKGLRATQNFPDVRFAVRHLFPRQPRRCVQLLLRWGLTWQHGADILASLQNQDFNSCNSTEQHKPCWELVPEAMPLARRYRAAMILSEKSEPVPRGVLELLETPRRLLRELEFLETRCQQQPECRELQLRAQAIRQRLGGGAEKWRLLREEIMKRMEQATAEAWLYAAEMQLQKCYLLRLKLIVGVLPENIEWTDDLMNATLLWSDIRCNKKWLRRLLEAHLAGEVQWQEKHPGNALFLRAMRHRGMNVDTWLSANARTYRCSEVKGEKVRLQIENESLRILQMGNYFDTCLSFGGINSFSTVANACELNKRVIYATDGEGNVIGRKLIAVNQRGELVGFYTYAALSHTKANQAVRRLFRRYVKGFAAQCNLSLAGEGRVPVLFVDDWYDDGIVDWSRDDEIKTSRKRTH